VFAEGQRLVNRLLGREGCQDYVVDLTRVFVAAKKIDPELSPEDVLLSFEEVFGGRRVSFFYSQVDSALK
jgi:hypothetical protein